MVVKVLFMLTQLLEALALELQEQGVAQVALADGDIGQPLAVALLDIQGTVVLRGIHFQAAAPHPVQMALAAEVAVVVQSAVQEQAVAAA